MYLKILWAAKIVHFLMVEKVSFFENDDKSLFNFHRLSLSAFMDRFLCSFFFLSFFFFWQWRGGKLSTRKSTRKNCRVKKWVPLLLVMGKITHLCNLVWLLFLFFFFFKNLSFSICFLLPNCSEHIQTWSYYSYLSLILVEGITIAQKYSSTRVYTLRTYFITELPSAVQRFWPI